MEAVASFLPQLIDTKGRKSTRCYRRRRQVKNSGHKAGRKSGTGPALSFPVGVGRAENAAATATSLGRSEGLRRWQEKSRGKVRSKAPVTGIFPVQGAGHEDCTKPVRDTHPTQAPLTRHGPSRRRPRSLCARSRGWQRRGQGQLAVTGGRDS